MDADQVTLIDPLAAVEHAKQGDMLANSTKIPDLEEAVRRYQAAVRLDPQNAEVQDKLRSAKLRIHYEKGVKLYKKGSIEQAVAEFKTAAKSGMLEIPELSEWFNSGAIRLGDWDRTQIFARTLKQLAKLNANLYNMLPQNKRGVVGSEDDAYSIAERKLKDIEFDSSFLHPFLLEAKIRREYYFLGTFVSAMINKIIKPDETITLDLSRYNTASKIWDENRWSVDFLAYRHAKGKLIIKGGRVIGGCLPACLCERMAGGEVGIHSDYGARLCLGQDMTGGKIHLYGKPLDNESIFIGRNMSGGEVNIYIDIKNAQIGEGLKGGAKINLMKDVIYDNPENYYGKDVRIGEALDGGTININGNAQGYVGNDMKSGMIKVKGSVIRGDIGVRMSGGQIIIDGNADVPIGEGMENGQITIGGSAGFVSPPLGGAIHVNGQQLTLLLEGDPARSYGEIWLRDRKIFPALGVSIKYGLFKERGYKTYR